jgi:hypothetical protein
LSSLGGVVRFGVFSAGSSFLGYVGCDLGEDFRDGRGMEVLGVVGVEVFENGEMVAVYGE